MIINNQDLTMNRGNSETITVTIIQEGAPKTLVSGEDVIYFTVKNNTNTADKVLQKVVTVFTDGAAVIDIAPADTKDLAARAYKYDIQWVSGAGEVRTVMGPALFTIAPTVTSETV